MNTLYVSLFLAAITSTSVAQSFVPIGFAPAGASSRAFAISEDGRWVVGNANGPFRWSLSTSLQSLGAAPSGFVANVATDSSSDGSVLVGYMNNGSTTQAFRWTAQRGIQVVPGLSSTVGGVFPRISANGLVIAGDTPADFGFSAPARWSAATGVVPVPALSGLPSGRTGVATTALALSADGSILAGSASVRLSQFEFINVPYTWNFASPSASVILNAGSFYLPPSGTFASDLSADGSVFVGFSGQGYVRWSQAEGLTLLGTGPGQLNASARISADGNAVVTGSFYWTTTDGARTIPAVLSAAGANFTGWSNLVATDLSANGLTLCGYGTNPQGQTEGWYATIPAPASLLTLLALPLTTRRRRTPRV